MLTRTRAVQLDKEKNLRRAWNTHGAQVQIFDAGTDAMANLYHLRDNLETACADPTRTNAGETTEQPSRRKQLVRRRLISPGRGGLGWFSRYPFPRQVILRNELRQSLKDVEAGVTKAENTGPRVDPVVEEARAAAREKQKRPLHLRGTIVLT